MRTLKLMLLAVVILSLGCDNATESKEPPKLRSLIVCGSDCECCKADVCSLQDVILRLKEKVEGLESMNRILQEDVESLKLVHLDSQEPPDFKPDPPKVILPEVTKKVESNVQCKRGCNHCTKRGLFSR